MVADRHRLAAYHITSTVDELSGALGVPTSMTLNPQNRGFFSKFLFDFRL